MELGIESSFHLADKDRVPEVSADYFHARWLGMGLGRFTTPDGPLVDQQVEDARSWNLYGYVRNNPLFGIDPSGRSCIKVQTRDPDGNLIDSDADDGDGKGCAAAGVNPITSSNSLPGSDIITHGVETKAQAGKELTQAERQEISLFFRDQLAAKKVLEGVNIIPTGPVIRATPKPLSRQPIDDSICAIAPTFVQANPGLFGAKPSSRPGDPLNSEEVPRTYMPDPNRRRGYVPIGGAGTGGRNEILINARFGAFSLISDYLKCKAILAGTN
ncbi:MAG: RHS repeat-associated core domain-containing protein [Bryobacter sp.]|nr:RHS repeat-associated core domain-containing protein [Bryobacter sp.]